MQDTKRVKNPGKQRKRLFNAPAHLRHKLMAAPLSNELAASRGAKTLPVRKGDTVRIQRGDNKGFEGKVSRVDTKIYRIFIEGFTREKVDGTNIFLPIHPSKVQIRTLNLDDKWRKGILDRKKEIEKPEQKAKAKPPKKVEKAPEQPQAKVEEVEEEKPVEALPVEEKAVAPEIAKEEAPAEQVPEKVAEKALEKAPAAKKAPAKKPAAKKAAPAKKKAAEEEAPVEEEKAPAKKAAKPRTAAKKAAVSKEAPAKEAAAKKTAPKPRAKRKTSKETEGGQ